MEGWIGKKGVKKRTSRKLGRPLTGASQKTGSGGPFFGPRNAAQSPLARRRKIPTVRRPMTNDECKKLVLDIIADIAPDEDISNLKPDVRLRDQMQLDSMDFLDIVMELRKRHNIEVPEADYLKLATLDGCAEYLVPKFAEQGK